MTLEIGGCRFCPVWVLAFRAMRTEDMRDAEKALAIEEADAWFEYLEAVRHRLPTGSYEDVESWAWARLTQRLHGVEDERSRLPRPAAA
jgi:hypothetical protein